MRGVAILVSCLACTTFAACNVKDPTSLHRYQFSGELRTPRALSSTDIDRAVRSGLRDGEWPTAITSIAVSGLGQTVVQVTAETPDVARAFVVDEDGTVLPTEEFWARERAARVARFGRMTPELFALASSLDSSALVDTEIMVNADVPEPQLPFDGTDQVVPSSDYMAWFSEHADSDVPVIAASKARVVALLQEQGAEIVSNPRGLPLIRAKIPVGLLTSQELNASDVVRIDIPQPRGALLGYAGHAAMNAGSLVGGACGTGTCSGDHIGVGLWERDSSATVTLASHAITLDCHQVRCTHT